MKTTVALLMVLATGPLATSASADGLPVVGLEASPDGVGAGVRYEALPYEGDTYVQRIRPSSGETLGTRVLQGRFEVPVVAYDGSADGLSTDGRTLVLIAPRPRFPRARTTLAVLDASSLRLRKRITMPGDYSFDALSPDGRWLYLIHYTAPKDPRQYDVLVMDLRTGKLQQSPIVDKREPDEEMNGHPLTRARSADGRWAYTLYEGAEYPFVHALDTAKQDSRCIDLDWLTGHEGLRKLRFAHRNQGRELTLKAPGAQSVAVVDTRTFEASDPSAAGVASWSKTGAVLAAFLAVLAALTYLIRRRPRSSAS